ncbi:hypothetical protein HDU91_000089 [Kappamyces sp. JEL0680]|nr:hypothetical protein HDU91_000089 [Kappamyces sp. JEL0680]
MGKQERVLTIDGEYIQLDAVESKTFFERGKSAVSYSFKDVISCALSKNGGATFRLAVQRVDGNKIYEFEAASARDAVEITSRFNYILEMRAKEGL